MEQCNVIKGLIITRLVLSNATNVLPWLDPLRVDVERMGYGVVKSLFVKGSDDNTSPYLVNTLFIGHNVRRYLTH